MRTVTGWVLAGGLLFAAVGAGAQDAARKPRGSFQAQRAGWMLGMYVGEEKGQRYPFVAQVDPKSDAKLKGIRPGDELIRFNDEEILDLGRIHEKANRLRPGQEVVLWVRRGSQTLRFELRQPRESDAPAAEKEKKSAKDGEEGEDPQKKKKSKKKVPVVIKPIPAGDN